MSAEALPIPPTQLILKVSGEADVEWFLYGGRQAAECIRSTLARQGVDPASIRSLLDFGCGCGRVARWWRDLPASVHGSDLEPRLVDWCRRRLPFGRFTTNELSPPLAYPEHEFDLVYALSVFTHLPQSLQLPWMRELRRILRPGAYLLLTTHGRRYLDDLPVEQRRVLEAGGLVVRHAEDPGSNACGAYHPEAYVRAHLAEGFTVIEHVPEGALGNPHQDLWLFRRDSAA
jgi:SAM-dependent methyltransferase